MVAPYSDGFGLTKVTKLILVSSFKHSLRQKVNLESLYNLLSN
jgi:hypothetical protein